jgi:integrase
MRGARRNYVRGEYGTPKSKRSNRAVPLIDRLAGELDRLSKASAWNGDDELAFAHPETGKRSTAQSCSSASRRR